MAGAQRSAAAVPFGFKPTAAPASAGAKETKPTSLDAAVAKYGPTEWVEHFSYDERVKLLDQAHNNELERAKN